MATRILPTPEELRQLLDYDPATGVLTWKARSGDDRETRRFNTNFAGRPANCKFTSGYMRVCIRREGFLAHRVAWAISHGSWPETPIDHINGVKSDNRLSNLRQATPAQNAKNRTLNKNNRSGCSGVVWRERHQHWQANIRSAGKTIHLGVFSAKFDAILARLLAEKELGFTMRHGTAA